VKRVTEKRERSQKAERLPLSNTRVSLMPIVTGRGA
jgi:hypothetical protein